MRALRLPAADSLRLVCSAAGLGRQHHAAAGERSLRHRDSRRHGRRRVRRPRVLRRGLPQLARAARRAQRICFGSGRYARRRRQRVSARDRCRFRRRRAPRSARAAGRILALAAPHRHGCVHVWLERSDRAGRTAALPWRPTSTAMGATISCSAAQAAMPCVGVAARPWPAVRPSAPRQRSGRRRPARRCRRRRSCRRCSACAPRSAVPTSTTTDGRTCWCARCRRVVSRRRTARCPPAGRCWHPRAPRWWHRPRSTA